VVNGLAIASAAKVSYWALLLKNQQIINTMTDKIIHIEAADHLITDEAKRHKLALMLVCSFVLMISYYHDAKVGSLFGIIKFTEDHEIGVLELIPFAIAVMLYHGTVYAYHYNEAKKAWINKVAKAIREEKISTFNAHALTIDNAKRDNIDFVIEKANVINNNIIMEKIRNLRTGLAEVEKSLHNETAPKDTRHTVRSLEEEMYTLQSKLSSNEMSFVSPLVDSIYPKIQRLNHQIEHDFWTQNKLQNIHYCCNIIEEVIDDFEKSFIAKYNYYLEENYKRNYRHNQCIKRSIAQRDLILNEMKKTSFNEKNATLLYKALPFLYFNAAFIYGIYIYLNNS